MSKLPEEKKRVLSYQRSQSRDKGVDKVRLPDDLPIEKHFLDVTEEEKLCSKTGAPLVKIGEEISSKIAQKPGSYYIKQLIRPKYGLSNGDGIVVAELPPTILDRCMADDSLLADIAVDKFANHIPLYRQSEIMSRQGIFISRQLLSQWLVRSGNALKPLYNELLSKVLESGNVFYDETPISMLKPGKGKTHKAYMWILVGGKEVNPSYRIYDFRTNRCHHNAENLLKNYKGVLHSDKYGAYEKVVKKNNLVWCPCWSHIRRKFFEAESGDPNFRKWILMKIKHLFMWERLAWLHSEDKRLFIRKEKELPLIEELIVAVKSKFLNHEILPKSKFREALGYFYNLIPYLKNYIIHPFARLDNNVAERAVRPLALGRKNWLFIGNECGGEAAGVFYSLIQTCRELKINPREYLEDVMRRLRDHSASRVSELLPDNWARQKKIH